MDFIVLERRTSVKEVEIPLEAEGAKLSFSQSEFSGGYR